MYWVLLGYSILLPFNQWRNGYLSKWQNASQVLGITMSLNFSGEMLIFQNHKFDFYLLLFSSIYCSNVLQFIRELKGMLSFIMLLHLMGKWVIFENQNI